MTAREFFIYTVEDELPRFERTYAALQAISEEKLASYRPDPKSKTAAELMRYMAVECATFPVFLKTGAVDFGEIMNNAFAAIAEPLTNLKESLMESKNIAANMTEADWDAEAKMTGGKDAWVTTKDKMAWALLLDLIHHRGQLSTYLRPMGGKVPPIYGPSADST